MGPKPQKAASKAQEKAAAEEASKLEAEAAKRDGPVLTVLAKRLRACRFGAQADLLVWLGQGSRVPLTSVIP